MEGKERKNPRLEGYDYRARQYYFITICTKNREPCLCRIEPEDGKFDGEKRIGLTDGLFEGEKPFVGAGHAPPVQPTAVVHLTREGNIVKNSLLEIPLHYKEAKIETYVIMPDHVHFIISVGCHGEEPGGACPAPTIPRKVTSMIGSFKSGASRQCGRPLWQRSFYDHIIRGEHDYYEIWQYIENNPLRWLLKKQHPGPENRL